MGKVTFNMTMSLDGFVAGLNDTPENGMGDGGDRLFNWYFNGDTEIPISDGQMVLKVSSQSAELLQDAFQKNGAEIWGRKTFDIAGAWGGHPPMTPCFIVTHTVPQQWAGKDSPFTFVTDGVESAIRQAKQAAGDKDVVICTANILQQCLNAGLMDEITINLTPVLLGKGVRLFDNLNIDDIELDNFQAINCPGVIHLAFHVARAQPGESHKETLSQTDYDQQSIG